MTNRAGFIKIALMAALSIALALGIPAAPPSNRVFTDVAPGSWYEPQVLDMARRGWLNGYPDGSFRPNRPVTAAELVAITARCAGVANTGGDGGHWASGYLRTGLDRGWYDWDEIPPTGETFGKPIQRQLAVKILMRALLPDVRGDYNTESQKIRDFSQLDGRYYEEVLAAYSVGVARGDGSGRFHPKSSLTRAEACTLIDRARRLIEELPAPSRSPAPSPGPTAKPISGGVAENGWLQVKGTQLCNEAGDPVVLHGMSSHGIQWFPQFAGEQAVKNTAAYGANLFRVAMYTGEGGYLSQPEAMKQRAIEAVDAAVHQDLYVILDWHILSDGNPMDHLSEAKAFFSEMAERYQDQPAVLYEICNEPNGNVDWARDIKPYAQEVAGAIREKSPRSVILIGSGTWSQDIHLAAADPLEGKNLMYTLHFYAGTHGQWLRDRAESALEAGLPLFVSEWGTSAADGSGGVYLGEAEVWLEFLEKKGISWANWSLCDKDETSAALKPGTDPSAQWTEQDLSPSGKFVFGRF